ncbi:MAG: hypothetical protein ACRDD1_19410, partial [Planctomycetia bacterium]
VVNLDAVRNNWGRKNIELMGKVGVPHLFDLTLYRQDWLLPDDFPVDYHFVPAALLPAEQAVVEQHRRDDRPRAIPWTMIGHATSHRLHMVETFTRRIDARGFVYMPRLTAFKNDDHHLGRAKIARILKETLYYVWCSHHDLFYIEGERFRDAALYGCVPIKIMADRPDFADLPFKSCLVAEEGIVETMRAMDGQAARRRFLEEYREWPGLADALADVVEKVTSGGRGVRTARPKPAASLPLADAPVPHLRTAA